MQNRMTALVAAALAGSAFAQPTFLVTNGSTLYRSTGGTVETFNLGDDIVGLAVADDGTIYASSSTASSTSGLFELYTLDDAGGTPTLNLVTDQLSNVYTGISVIGDTIYSSRGGGPLLFAVDLNTFSETNLGNTGLPVGIGGSAYRAADDTYFWSEGVDDLLYEVDRTTATATAIGSFGIDTGQQGLEFFEGQLYFATDNETTGRLEIGTLNQNSGAYSFLQVIDPVNVTGTVSLAVIPTPASGALLALGGLLATRRRR